MIEARSYGGRNAAVVPLSPACASCDQFLKFEAGGEASRTLAEALPEAGFKERAA